MSDSGHDKALQPTPPVRGGSSAAVNVAERARQAADGRTRYRADSKRSMSDRPDEARSSGGAIAPEGWETMEFRIDQAVPILRRTPGVLRSLLLDLPTAWTGATDGAGTWSPFDVVGHLIHGERTDWVPRIEHMLRHSDTVPFPAFDREAMFTASRGLVLRELLETFDRLRTENLARLGVLGLTDADLARRGRHPELGVVTMGQHLATWVAHDLGHVGQVVRVMARQYSEAVGPWRAYLSILGSA